MAASEAWDKEEAAEALPPVLVAAPAIAVAADVEKDESNVRSSRGTLSLLVLVEAALMTSLAAAAAAAAAAPPLTLLLSVTDADSADSRFRAGSIVIKDDDAWGRDAPEEEEEGVGDWTCCAW